MLRVTESDFGAAVSRQFKHPRSMFGGLNDQRQQFEVRSGGLPAQLHDFFCDSILCGIADLFSGSQSVAGITQQLGVPDAWSGHVAGSG